MSDRRPSLDVTRDEALSRAIALGRLADQLGDRGGVARWAARLLTTAPESVFQDADDRPACRCGRPLDGRQREWCSEACRSRWRRTK